MPHQPQGVPMKIRPAEEHQREDWLDMRLALWPDCPRAESSREITRILQSEREAGFVAIDQSGRVVGFAEVSTREYVDGCSTSPVGYVEGLYVRPECRGQGNGARPGWSSGGLGKGHRVHRNGL